ncbi:MAG TPA: glycosyltransferase [Nitrospira sp.]|nr:glycosyltransferase [Nitrospira sp.]
MKILIANTDYFEFLSGLYQGVPGLSQKGYDEQLQVRYDSRFGVADFYSRHMRALGHEAHDIYVNNLAMQRAWMREHSTEARDAQARTSPGNLLESLLEYADRSVLGRVSSRIRSLLQRRDDEGCRILAAQVAYHRPDVFLNQAMDGIDSAWMHRIKPWVRLLVGQHAATTLPDDDDYRCYDLVVSSFPPTVEFFARKGIPAVLHRLGFDPDVLATHPEPVRVYPVTFVGSLSDVHTTRIEWLEHLCVRIPELRIWGPGIERLKASSPLRQRHMGLVWGNQMYDVLRRSQITLNHHGDVAPYANNCRLFEATGMGAMLLTDWKANLQDMFQIGKEVAAYRTTEECAEMIRYYLKHDEARMAVARAGQTRTLRDHTYRSRMQEFVELTQKRMVA